MLGLLVSLPSMADGIYKWVDQDGQVHFSDVPQDGSEEIAVAPPQTFSLPEPSPSYAVSSTKKSDEAEQSDQMAYETLAITSPVVEETIWNTGGKVTVAVSLQPGLQTGHQISLYMDGQKLADLPPRVSSLELSDVYRGEHLLTAEVRDENGKTMISSTPVKFFYQQTAVNRR